MAKKLQTPSQTVGPFFAYGLTPEQYAYEYNSLVDGEMVNPLDDPDAITLSGQIFDGQGQLIPDAMIEIWLNDGKKELFGRYGTGTDPQNRFIFHCPKPKATEGHAPFLTVILFMRGQLIHLYTRIYFSDEEALNAKDPVLNAVPEDRRHTLIAQKKDVGYVFNIHMQGKNETVFFDV